MTTSKRLSSVSPIVGLIPTIIQDSKTSQVYMLAYMSQQSLQLTLSTGYVHFFSRRRLRLWLKGETSGNRLRYINHSFDCDNDTILMQVQLDGTHVCHTGTISCFSKYFI